MAGEFDDIINQVMDEQIPPGKTMEEVAMMRPPFRGTNGNVPFAAGGGGSSYGVGNGAYGNPPRSFTGLLKHLFSRPYQPPPPSTGLPGPPKVRSGVSDLPSGNYPGSFGASYGTRVGQPTYGPMNNNRRFQVVPEE